MNVWKMNLKDNKDELIFGKVLKHILKRKWIYLTILATITIFISTICILNIIKSNKIEKSLEGRYFIIESTWHPNNYYDIYLFKNGKLSNEEWRISINGKEKSSHGNLNEYKEKYRVKASIFNNKAKIERYDTKWLLIQEITITPNGKIKGENRKDYQHYEWYETTLDEIEIKRKEKFCEHEWKQKKVLKEASCSDSGEALNICSKCGLEKTETITVEHNYSGRVCTVCGKEKPKRKSYTVEADTWYTYTPLDILKVQNCEVSSAYGAGSAVAVAYYPICKNCHIISDVIKMNAPEINYSISKLYHCDECGQSTIVQLIIDN